MIKKVGALRNETIGISPDGRDHRLGGFFTEFLRSLVHAAREQLGCPRVRVAGAAAISDDAFEVGEREVGHVVPFRINRLQSLV